MRLVTRSLLREVALPTVASLVFLLQLLLMVRLLSQADVLLGAGVRIADLGKLFLYLLPPMISSALPVSFLLGVLVGLGRLADDRELTALFALGLGPRDILRPPLLVGAAVLAVLMTLTLWLEPLAVQHASALVRGVVQRNLVKNLKPGSFYEDLSDLTVYAGRVDDNGQLGQVMIHDAREPEAPLLLLAEEGRVRGENGELVLELGRGELHRAELAGDDYGLARFDRGAVAVLVEREIAKKNRLRPFEDHTLPRLLGRSRALQGKPGKEPRGLWVEIHRRFAHPFVAVAFALIAVAVGGRRPPARRGSQAAAYLWTAGAVIAYFVLVKVGATLGYREVIPAPLAAWGPALILGAPAAWVLARAQSRGLTGRRAPG